MSIVVSVVVPTYRRPKLLGRCIAALAAQDFDPSGFEVIVVDDAASEATRRQVEAWEDRFLLRSVPVAEPRVLAQPKGGIATLEVERDEPAAAAHLLAPFQIRYLAVSGRHGPAVARNFGWRAARGGIIAFTDDDCVPDSNWLGAGVNAFESPDGRALAGVWGRIVVPLRRRPTDYERNAARLEEAVFATANCFWRRDALEAAGGFDERFEMAWREDSDLHFTLLERGARLAHVPEAVVVHPVRPAGWGVSLAEQRKSLYNALLYKKHLELYRKLLQARPPWKYYITLFALILAMTGLSAGQMSMATVGLIAWTYLTLEFSIRRLRGASLAPGHVLEMLVTSALIPPLAVYWRLRGAIRFHVPFL